MILGASRNPFTRPPAASGAYVPQLPNTGFYSHFHPLTLVTHAMDSTTSAYRPPLVPSMGPHALPDVPLPAPPVAAAAPVAPPVPKAGGTAGFGGSGFGSPGAMQHAHVDPYMVMRQGVIPGVFPSGSNIRAGVRNTAARVHRSMPFQTAPLPPPPPPPAPVMVPATSVAPAAPATGMKGLMGTLADHLGLGAPWWRRRRHHFAPAMVAAGTCEKLGPRTDGTYVTICNGRVTEVSDAAGNVHQNPFA